MKLKELLENFEWSWYDKDAPKKYELNTKVVRVYDGREDKCPLPYFEIGRSTGYNETEYPLEDFLRIEILDAEVSRYTVDDYLDILCIYITNEETK